MSAPTRRARRPGPAQGLSDERRDGPRAARRLARGLIAASTWPSSGRRAAGSPPCCSCSAASTRPRRARVEMLGTRLDASVRPGAHPAPPHCGSASSFSASTSCPVLTARENVELPMAEAGVPAGRAPGARARAARRTSGLGRPRRTTGRPSSPVARCSGSRSPGRWPTGPRCCSPTSPPVSSTRPPARRSSSSSAASTRDGTTLVVVTHDERLAARGGAGDPHARRQRSATDARSPSPSATSGSGRLRSALPPARLLARRRGDGGAALGGRGDAGPESRDVSLVGGGEVTVLPQGIDIEAMRTGGLGGMFFAIDRARFLTRQVLGGPAARGHGPHRRARHRGKAGVSLRGAGALRSGGGAGRRGDPEPRRARWAPASMSCAGRWADSPADSAYVAPARQQLYDELDRFHIPAPPDSTWGEWQYFNLVDRPGRVVVHHLSGRRRAEPDPVGDRWGGRLLVTHRRPDGRYERFTADVPGRPGPPRHRPGRLDHRREHRPPAGRGVHLRGRATGPAAGDALDLELRPRANRYFPPVELRDDAFLSGYVVPRSRRRASGTDLRRGPVLRGPRRARVSRPQLGRLARRDLGMGRRHRARDLSLLYGGVYGLRGAGSSAVSPFFLTLVDSLGVRQVLRFRRIDYEGAPAGRRRARCVGARAVHARGHLGAGQRDAPGPSRRTRSPPRCRAARSAGLFFQMRGDFTLRGRVAAPTCRTKARDSSRLI